MDISKILSCTDHTLLSPTATWFDIRHLCDEAVTYKTASVCIPPSFVKAAKNYLGEQMRVCTVIGFPNGYHSLRVKEYETQSALADGADEVDMVLSLGAVKEGDFRSVEDEISLIRRAAQTKTLKVIVETCLLTREEKIRLCRVVGEAGADYIKTSTGFSKKGATPEDVALFAENIKPPLRIKAAGGISTLEDAWRFLSLGADRLGSSRVVKLVQEMQNQEENG